MNPTLCNILLDLITFSLLILQRLQEYLRNQRDSGAYLAEAEVTNVEEQTPPTLSNRERTSPITTEATPVRRSRARSRRASPVRPQFADNARSDYTGTWSTDSTAIDTPTQSDEPVYRVITRTPEATWRGTNRARYNHAEDGLCGHYCHTARNPRLTTCPWCQGTPDDPSIARTWENGSPAPTGR
jgi:hypothetical protein